MKRATFILLLGFGLAVAGYCLFYFTGSMRHREALQNSPLELAWLKSEFQLNDAEFTQVRQLHLAYTPHCEEMCRRIDKLNAELSVLVLQTNAITPEIEKKMTEAAQLHLECQKMLLNHFYDVSRQMPSQQGKRFLAIMRQKTVLSK